MPRDPHDETAIKLHPSDEKIVVETARVHGRLLESAHIAGYTFNRAADELKWLLKDDRWKGLGFADGAAFAESIYGLFKEFKGTIEQRKEVAQQLAGVASQRAIAKVLGVNASTVSRDLSVANATDAPEKPNKNGPSNVPGVANATPGAPAPWFNRDGEAAAKLLSLKTRGTQGTGENEWYTPPEYIELARKVLGVIDLDPASSDHAQKAVRAARYFTVEDNGLNQEWHGSVWLNPPYAQPDIGFFAEKMCEEVDAGRVKAAVMLTHNYTDTTWFQGLARHASAICFTRGRIRFVNPSGDLAAPTQGQAFFYFGDDGAAFRRAFDDVGLVIWVRP